MSTRTGKLTNKKSEEIEKGQKAHRTNDPHQALIHEAGKSESKA